MNSPKEEGKSTESSASSSQPSQAPVTVRPPDDSMVTTPEHLHGPIILEKGHWEFYAREKLDAIPPIDSLDQIQRFIIVMIPSATPADSETEALISRIVHHKLSHSARERAEESEREKHLAPVMITKAMLQGDDAAKKCRAWIMGKKRLPHPSGGVRVTWSYVERVGTKEEVLRLLEGRHYRTEEKERHLQAAAYMGTAVYELILEGRSGDTRFVYKLEYPTKPHFAQRMFGIEKEGNFRAVVKNPDAPNTKGQQGLDEDDRAMFPDALKAVFKGKNIEETRYVPVNPPALMNMAGVELLVFPSRKDVKKAVGELVSKQMDDDIKEETSLSEELDNLTVNARSDESSSSSSQS